MSRGTELQIPGGDFLSPDCLRCPLATTSALPSPSMSMTELAVIFRRTLSPADLSRASDRPLRGIACMKLNDLRRSAPLTGPESRSSCTSLTEKGLTPLPLTRTVIFESYPAWTGG